MSDLIRRQDAIDKANRIMKVNGIPYDKAWFTPIGVITLINELPSTEPEIKWETCFDCPLSHGCPKIQGCTNEQAMKYASEIPGDCPINCSAIPNSWIPCSERLPKKDGEYLVCYEAGYREDYNLDEVGIAPFEVDCEGFGIWQEDFDPVSLGSLGSDWVDIPVIAWMPLPAPYRPKEDES